MSEWSFGQAVCVIFVLIYNITHVSANANHEKQPLPLGCSHTAISKKVALVIHDA